MVTNAEHDVAPAGPEPVHWVPLQGHWEVLPEELVFRGRVEQPPSYLPLGQALSSRTLQAGTASVTVQFSDTSPASYFGGGLLLGYRSADRYQVRVQLGSGSAAYSVTELITGSGWRPVETAGPLSALRANQPYDLHAEVLGQQIRVKVDGIQVLEALLSRPLEGRQVGVVATGEKEIRFTNFKVTMGRPRLFVAMQYGEPFDEFYRHVIRPQAEKQFQVVRMDEKTGPGVIFQDMQREIEQADIFIAEITPANLNVFYELGYAHALKKPTILLAQRGGTLPFDISSFRVVFYDDTIGGKTRIEQDLAKHLDAIQAASA